MKARLFPFGFFLLQQIYPLIQQSTPVNLSKILQYIPLGACQLPDRKSMDLILILKKPNGR